MTSMKMTTTVSAISIAALLLGPLVMTIPVPAQMIGLSTFIIVMASFAAAERERQRKRDGDNAEARDTIGRDQAWRFPLVASCALFGMFLAFKYLPKDWVSILLTLYGVGFGTLAMASLISPKINSIPGIPEFAKKEVGIKDILTLSICDVFAVALAFPFGYWYFKTKYWFPNNVLAVSLALSAVDALALSDFVSGVVLLSGLFFYDIFWVFFSKQVFGDNVMVSVAKQFDGPIKLIFPRFLGADSKNVSMLGLGDIVIPGLFVALTLRFDIRKHPINAPLTNLSMPYFISTVISYILGLVSTIVALNVYNAAQPALLYLVPCCLAASIGTSLVKGEFTELMAYAEEDSAKSDEKTAGKAQVDSATSKKDE